jgi:hypothetical protein
MNGIDRNGCSHLFGEALTVSACAGRSSGSKGGPVQLPLPYLIRPPTGPGQFGGQSLQADQPPDGSPPLAPPAERYGGRGKP